MAAMSYYGIGEAVVVCNVTNPLANQETQDNKSMPIDLNWKPPMFHIMHPDPINTKVFIRDGELLTILSEEILPPVDCVSYLYLVKDKDNNEFYLSTNFFKKTI